MKGSPQKANPKLVSPKWHNPPFARMSGLSDGLLGKAKVQSGPDGKRLYSGRIRVQEDRFRTYEARVEKQLLAAAAPLQKEAGGLAGLVRAAPASRADTTGASRQAARIDSAHQRLTELNCDLESLIRQADCVVEIALSKANTWLGQYCKASKFYVLEEEIPRLRRSRSFREITLIPADIATMREENDNECNSEN